jgi:hypothetical protein
LVFILITAGIFAYDLVLQQTNNRLLQQISSQKAAIDTFKNVEGLQAVLVQRLTHLDRLLAKKNDHCYFLLNLLEKIMPLDVSLAQLTQKADLVSLSLKVVNVSALDTFLKAFDQEISQKDFPFKNKIEIASVNRTDENFYDVIINLAGQPTAHVTPKE